MCIETDKKKCPFGNKNSNATSTLQLMWMGIVFQVTNPLLNRLKTVSKFSILASWTYMERQSKVYRSRVSSAINPIYKTWGKWGRDTCTRCWCFEWCFPNCSTISSMLQGFLIGSADPTFKSFFGFILLAWFSGFVLIKNPQVIYLNINYICYFDDMKGNTWFYIIVTNTSLLSSTNAPLNGIWYSNTTFNLKSRDFRFKFYQ